MNENSTKKSHLSPNHFQTIFGWFWYTMKLFIHTRAGNRIFCQNLNWNVRMVLQCDHLLKVSEKVTQKLVLSARNQKLNIATQIFPLTMYPIVLECFASLTWRNLLSYLCEKKKNLSSHSVWKSPEMSHSWQKVLNWNL